jgi:hypothetical protein
MAFRYPSGGRLAGLDGHAIVHDTTDCGGVMLSVLAEAWQNSLTRIH